MDEVPSPSALLHFHPQLVYQVVLSHALLLQGKGVGLECQLLEPDSAVVVLHAVLISILVGKIFDKRSGAFECLGGGCFCDFEWVLNVSVASVILIASQAILVEVV